METFPSIRSTSAAGSFGARFSQLLLAVVAVVAAMGTDDGLRAGPPQPPVAASISVGPRIGNSVTVSFNQTGSGANNDYDAYGVLYGGDFINLSALSRSQHSGTNLFVGSIISITANVTLRSYEQDINGGPQTYDVLYNPDYSTAVDDLAIYVGVVSPISPNPPSTPINFFNTQSHTVTFSGGLLQLGGTNGTGATRDYWSNYSNSASDPLKDLTGVSVPVNVGLNAVSPEEVWLANAYTSGNSFGRWSGTIDFTFASSGGSGVPDASRTALLLAPGTLVLLGLAGRSRRRN